MPLWKIILGVYIGGVIAFTAHAHFFDEYYRHLGLIPNLGRGLLWFVFCLPLIGKTVALIVSLFFLATWLLQGVKSLLNKTEKVV